MPDLSRPLSSGFTTPRYKSFIGSEAGNTSFCFLAFLPTLAKSEEGLLIPREENALNLDPSRGVEILNSGLLAVVAGGGAIADRFKEDSTSLNSWYRDLERSMDGEVGHLACEASGICFAALDTTHWLAADTEIELVVAADTGAVVATLDAGGATRKTPLGTGQRVLFS